MLLLSPTVRGLGLIKISMTTFETKTGTAVACLEEAGSVKGPLRGPRNDIARFIPFCWRILTRRVAGITDGIETCDGYHSARLGPRRGLDGIYALARAKSDFSAAANVSHSRSQGSEVHFYFHGRQGCACAILLQMLR